MAGSNKVSKQQEEMRMSKDGLCAIVTGSASGLGAATAAILAKGGARIVVNYSSSQKEAEQTADLCRSAGGEVVVVQGDVSRDEDCKKIVAAAAPWGRINALINNAGITKHVAHAASKGALNTITSSFARALAPLIRVNTVCPGYIDTPWFTKGRGEAGAKQVRDMVVSKVPLKVASTADDIAALVCFLAAPQSSNMTGELVRMDAGLHLIT